MRMVCVCGVAHVCADERCAYSLRELCCGQGQGRLCVHVSAFV